MSSLSFTPEITSYPLTTIKQNPFEFIVPKWIMDDVSKFYPETSEWIKSENNNQTTFDILYLKKFTQLRNQMYWMCKWYNKLITTNVPVIESKLYHIGNDVNIMVKILSNEFLSDDTKFLRFCNASPKDVVTPIFDNETPIHDIVNVFKTSKRTKYMLDDCCAHLVIRPIVEINHEVRCFWHKYKLRAVSGPDYHVEQNVQKHIEQTITQFFDNYGKTLTYNSAVIDVGMCGSNAFIIEINNFGTDMLTGAGHFDWGSDCMTLYNSETPVFKYKEEFSWY